MLYGILLRRRQAPFLCTRQNDCNADHIGEVSCVVTVAVRIDDFMHFMVSQIKESVGLLCFQSGSDHCREYAIAS